MGPSGTSSSSVLMTKGPRREKPLDESCNATGLTLMVPSYVWSTLPSLTPTMSYYEHWLRDEGQKVRFHHVCRNSLSTCKRKVGGEPIAHIQKMAFMRVDEV